MGVVSLREQFVIGVTASFPAATVAQVDAGLVKCHRQLQRHDLTPARARNLRADIDRLLDRRAQLTDGELRAPRARGDNHPERSPVP